MQIFNQNQVLMNRSVVSPIKKRSHGCEIAFVQMYSGKALFGSAGRNLFALIKSASWAHTMRLNGGPTLGTGRDLNGALELVVPVAAHVALHF
jgi:hypothetical protein